MKPSDNVICNIKWYSHKEYKCIIYNDYCININNSYIGGYLLKINLQNRVSTGYRFFLYKIKVIGVKSLW